MNSELTRTVKFNKNPANIELSLQSKTLAGTTTATNTAAVGTATTTVAGASSFGAFFTTKAGIILISVIATVVVATVVVVPVVVTQNKGNDSNATLPNHESGIGPTTTPIEDNPTPGSGGEESDTPLPTSTPHAPGEIVNFYSDMLSLTQNNFLDWL